MITDYHSILKTVRTMAGNAGMGLEIVNDTSVVPHTTGKKIVVHNPTLYTDLTWWRYSVYHEIRHNTVGKDLWDIIHETKDNKFLSTLWNFLEDFRIEYLENGKYAGEKRILDLGRKAHLDRQLESKEITKLKSVTDEKSLFIHGLAIWETRLRASFNHELVGYDSKLRTVMSDDAGKVADDLEQYSEELFGCLTARDTLNLARRMYENELSDDSRQECEETSTTPQGTENEESESPKIQPQESWIKYEEIILAHEHNPDRRSTIKIDYYTAGRGDFTPRTKEDIREVSFPNNNMCINTGFKYSLEGKLSSRVSKELRKLLQARSLSMYDHGRKQGKLSSKNVYRATMNGTGSYQQKICKQKIDKIDLDVAVTILGDCSASMGGRKYLNMSAACINLSEALKPLHIPHEIIGFGCSTKLMQYIIKSFSCNPSRDQIVDTFSQVEEYLSCNSDGESLVHAWDRLRRHSAKRKVIIILSDGQPAASISGDAYNYTKTVIQELESIKGLDLYAIGIEDDCVRDLYKNWTMLDSSANIETCIIDLVKSKILKGN